VETVGQIVAVDCWENLLASIGELFTQLQVDMHDPAFWVALTKIIWINVLLSGDNALVIAMACRGLAPKQRFWGMVLGAGVAVLLRVIFTGIVATLMVLPYLKIIGGLALVFIAAKLLVPQEEDEDGVEAASHLWAAVRVVAIADIIMSLDNVIAVAAAANGSVLLLIIGLAISIPLIVAGAALIMAVLDRMPILIWLGAALLGWIAGSVIATDPALVPALHALVDGHISLVVDWHSSATNAVRETKFAEDLGEFALAILGIVVVLGWGSFMRRKKLTEMGAPAEAI
jgi:YjbE family integral membrane protein